MNKMKLRILFTVFVLFSLPVDSRTQTQKMAGGIKNQYKQIEVLKFEVQAGIDFPPEYVTGLSYETIMTLQHLRKFDQVLHEDETPTNAAAPTIRISGIVTKYQPGSRTKRYLIGLGAGKTKIVTHIKFIDKATGNILYEADASGAVSWGVFGGQSRISLSNVGKKIAEITKKEFF